MLTCMVASKLAIIPAYRRTSYRYSGTRLKGDRFSVPEAEAKTDSPVELRDCHCFFDRFTSRKSSATQTSLYATRKIRLHTLPLERWIGRSPAGKILELQRKYQTVVVRANDISLMPSITLNSSQGHIWYWKFSNSDTHAYSTIHPATKSKVRRLILQSYKLYSNSSNKRLRRGEFEQDGGNCGLFYLNRDNEQICDASLSQFSLQSNDSGHWQSWSKPGKTHLWYYIGSHSPVLSNIETRICWQRTNDIYTTWSVTMA
jgi:hypothetical protein